VTVETTRNRKTPAGNEQLAARARDIAARAVLESDDPDHVVRKAALSAAVCLFTTSSITAARKALVQIEDEQLRQAAADIITQLVDGPDRHDL
jgi:hypothetical protein